MQTAAPEAFSLAGNRRDRATYADQPKTETFGKQCRYAAADRGGVRFVQLYHTTGGFQPGTSTAISRGHEKTLATDSDRRTPARDLKRGLLEDTLVIWGGNSGGLRRGNGQRTRPSSVWLQHGLAGGESKRNGVWCDRRIRLGCRRKSVMSRDLHATIPHLLGLDQNASPIATPAATSASPTSTAASWTAFWQPARCRGRSFGGRGYRVHDAGQFGATLAAKDPRRLRFAAIRRVL
jgi:hypothetical protein